MELELRQCGVENIKELHWIKGDTGAWTGPLADWIECKDSFMSNVSNFDTVVQAGGCCGMYPRFYKNYFKNVYTFEPNPDNYECLKKNCDGIQGILHGQYALGPTPSKVSMNYARPGGDDINVGMHTINNTPGDINMIMIDQLNLSACDLIHLDIEGFEEGAIYGALQTITKYWPVIIVERGNGRNLLERLGYVARATLKMDVVFVKDHR